MEISGAIILGVISGILTSGFLWLCVKFFNLVLVPWYQSIVYRGAIIEGEWSGFYQNEEVAGQTAIINLKQKGHIVTGQITLTKQPNGKECQKIFSCAGIFKNNNLILNYDAFERSRLGSGSYVMALVSDGNRLEGMSVYFSSYKNTVFSLKEYWVRAK